MVYKVPFKLSHYPSQVHVYKTKKRTLIIPTLLEKKETSRKSDAHFDDVITLITAILN